jgi:hypothetical protein
LTLPSPAIAPTTNKKDITNFITESDWGQDQYGFLRRSPYRRAIECVVNSINPSKPPTEYIVLPSIPFGVRPPATSSKGSSSTHCSGTRKPKKLKYDYLGKIKTKEHIGGGLKEIDDDDNDSKFFENSSLPLPITNIITDDKRYFGYAVINTNSPLLHIFDEKFATAWKIEEFMRNIMTNLIPSFYKTQLIDARKSDSRSKTVIEKGIEDGGLDHEESKERILLLLVNRYVVYLISTINDTANSAVLNDVLRADMPEVEKNQMDADLNRLHRELQLPT